MSIFSKTDKWSCHENWWMMIILPAIIFVIAVFSEYSGFDVWWVSHFYDAQNQIWTFKHHWLFDTVLHSGGQLLDKFFVVCWLLIFIIANCKSSLSYYRKIPIYFLFASVAGPIIVGFLKSTTHIYTPWDLALFNGKYPYIRIFDAVPPGQPIGHAFPAGHASGGYCFLNLFFVFHQIGSLNKSYGILAGLLLGLFFGVGQQVRGAHFPSHDMFTAVICWYSSLLLYYLFFRKECCQLMR